MIMTTPIYTTQELNTLYFDLPFELKEFITSTQTARIVEEIADGHGLTVEQHMALGSEIGLALMGLTTPEETTKNIVARLEISSEQAEAILIDADEEILTKALDIYEKNEAKLPKTPDLAESLDRESVLQEIENPSRSSMPASPLDAPSIIGNRLGTMTRMPRKEEIVVTDKKLPSTLPTPSSITPANVPGTPMTPPSPNSSYKITDPYREKM